VDFAHNIRQRIILNHAIVYNETIPNGIHRHILLTLKFQLHIYSCALDWFVLSSTSDNYCYVLWILWFFSFEEIWPSSWFL